MRPTERSFEGWKELYSEMDKLSEMWWEALDNMRLTASCSKDWSEYFAILDDNPDVFPKGHPEWVLASNGIGFSQK